jgi:hypothetical protein
VLKNVLATKGEAAGRRSEGGRVGEKLKGFEQK